MTMLVWKFEGFISEPGELDPQVTAYLGETYTNDTTGEKAFHRDSTVWVNMPLSQLPAFLANPTLPEGKKLSTPGSLPSPRPPAPQPPAPVPAAPAESTTP